MSQAKEAQIAQLAATVSSGMNSIATTNFVVNIILSFGLKYLWNFVNLLQFLVFIPKWRINIPQNALVILQQLKSIALMEFIPTKQITGGISGWFGMDPDDDNNLFNSMGLMLVIAIAILVLIIALFVASYFVLTSYRAYKTFRGVCEKIFYNTFLRYMIQSVLKVGLASAGALAAINWNAMTPSKAISVSISSTILFVLGCSPLFFGVVLKLNFNRLARPSVKRSIGTIYLSIKENNKVALAYSSIFMLRRIVFIALTFGLSD